MKVKKWSLPALVLLLATVTLSERAIPTAAQSNRKVKPVARAALKHDTSPPLRSLRSVVDLTQSPGRKRALPRFPLLQKRGAGRNTPQGRDPLLQREAPAPKLPMPPPIQNFEGNENLDNKAIYGFEYVPPDTNGDVGPNHYVQFVNVVLSIYDKLGNRLYGPVSGSTLWAGFGGPCAQHDDGDPIVLYDQLADRWLISQFAVPGYGNPAEHFYECIAISQTGDPTGAYYRYAFLVSETKFEDYPKFGIWPNAYYMSANQYEKPNFDFAGAGAFAFDRARMLKGEQASFIYFDTFVEADLSTHCFGGQLPADLDGSILPPAGAPGIFAQVDDANMGPDNCTDSSGGPDAPTVVTDSMRVWHFRPDFQNPENSTFGTDGSHPNFVIPVADFALLPCVLSYSQSCIPQPNAPAVDAIGDRLMFRLAYRNFGDHDAMVVNHTVDATGGTTHVAGIRWYEVRNPLGSPTIFQQGTFNPDGTHHRWMGSIAMDHAGNMALGYSVSSETLHPSVRYAGRLATDPAGTLPQSETSLVEGTASQLEYPPNNRWGDYSSLTVDSTDDCTFWYTQEYYETSSDNNPVDWKTRIGSFRFPACISLPPVTPTPGTPTPTATPVPRRRANVEDTSVRIQYDAWQGMNNPAASGGAFRVNRIAGESAKLRFNGTKVTWITMRGPDQGEANVWIDGNYKGTFDLYSFQPQFGYQIPFGGLSAGYHTINVEVAGTKNAAATNTFVIVDAFLVGSTLIQESAIPIRWNQWQGKSNANATRSKLHRNPRAGALARFEFDGTRIIWITAKGPSYGKANIYIDGSQIPGDVDLYAPNQIWRYPYAVNNLRPGHHRIEIVVAGKKDARSRGRAIIVDAFRGRFRSTATLIPSSELASSDHRLWFGDLAAFFLGK